LIQEFAFDFIARHRDKPFFLYYPTVLVHGPLLPTPDSPPGAKRPRTELVTYLDKQMGKLVEELERQKLREKTIILFTSDNGTPQTDTVRGKALDGVKNTLREGGSRVPLIVSWKGTIAAGQVRQDLVDFSDFFPTLAGLAGAKLPDGVTIDGRSFAPQLRGQPGKPRDWVYVHLNDDRYVRDARWKLYGNGTLCDMKEAPFREIPVAKGTEDAAALAARQRLQAALARLK
jgi:arylsulfatase A